MTRHTRVDDPAPDDDPEVYRTGAYPDSPAQQARNHLTVGIVAGIVVTAAAAAIAVFALSGGGSAPEQQKPVAGTSSKPAGKKPAVTPKLGTTRSYADHDVKLHVTAYRYKLLKATEKPQRHGYVYAGVDIKACVDKILTGRPTQLITWSPWELGYRDGTTVNVVQEWSAEVFSVPLYPADKHLRAGQCQRGWALYEVRKGSKPTTLTYAPDGGGAPISWKVR